MDRIGRIANLVVFEIGWFLCVLGGAYGWEWAGPAALALVVGTQLALLESGRVRELILIAACGAAGTLVDSILATGGILGFPRGSWLAPICPFWFSVLWMNFGTLPTGCLSWMRGRYRLAAIFGLIGGPISYYAGARMGALTMHPNIALSLGIVGLEWAAAMPGILWLGARLQRNCPRPVSGVGPAVAP